MKKNYSSLLIICFSFFLICSLFAEHPHKYSENSSTGKNLAESAWKVEHSVWVEDWTANLDTDAYIAALPRGVTTINVFVGQLALVDGVATINGYTLDTPNLFSTSSALDLTDLEKNYQDQLAIRLGAPTGSGAFPNIAALTDFVTRCKAAGMAVQLSIGGQPGTTFGNSWTVLTENNIQDFAQALVSICTTTTADGIDFDEELEDTITPPLAGKLAGAFKDLAPNLTTSYCVFGGCDASGPWHSTNTTFLQNAVTSENLCAIDRVYIMTYYDGCSLAQNEGFLTSWIQWLADQHSFTAEQISAGVDPNDPNTSLSNGSLNTWIDFAASCNLGTAIWDQLGVDDYVNNDWGTEITNIYIATTDQLYPCPILSPGPINPRPFGPAQK